MRERIVRIELTDPFELLGGLAEEVAYNTTHGLDETMGRVIKRAAFAQELLPIAVFRELLLENFRGRNARLAPSLELLVAV